MRAGKLRHRLVIQQKSTTRSATGAEVVTWSTVATVWAAIDPLQGREFLEAKRVRDNLSTQIRIRYRSGIVPEMRATWNGHTFDILSVIRRDEMNREIILMCREIT